MGFCPVLGVRVQRVRSQGCGGRKWLPKSVIIDPPHSSLGTECPPELSIQLLSPLPILALQTSSDPLFLSVWETIFTNVFLLPEFPLALQGLSSLLVSMGLHSTWELLRGARPPPGVGGGAFTPEGKPAPMSLLALTWLEQCSLYLPLTGSTQVLDTKELGLMGCSSHSSSPSFRNGSHPGRRAARTGKTGQRTPPLRLTLAAPSRGFHVTLCMCVWLG